MFYLGLCSITSRYLYLHITGLLNFAGGSTLSLGWLLSRWSCCSATGWSNFSLFPGGSLFISGMSGNVKESAKSVTGMASGRPGMMSSSVNLIVCQLVNDFCFNFIIFGSFNIFGGLIHLCTFPPIPWTPLQ